MREYTRFKVDGYLVVVTYEKGKPFDLIKTEFKAFIGTKMIAKCGISQAGTGLIIDGKLIGSNGLTPVDYLKGIVKDFLESLKEKVTKRKETKDGEVVLCQHQGPTGVKMVEVYLFNGTKKTTLYEFLQPDSKEIEKATQIFEKS